MGRRHHLALRIFHSAYRRNKSGLRKNKSRLRKNKSRTCERGIQAPCGTDALTAAGSGIRRHKPSVGQVRPVAKPSRKQRIDTQKVHKVKKLRFCDKKNKPSFDFSNFSFHICPRSFRRMSGGQGDLRHLQNSHLSDTSRLPKRLILTDKQITKPPARS